ncbi:hypothetical protein RHO15_07165 [Utexia brackfieldae]|uniref:hypothetical protein n=1 Tax=Utexia brackfieldae TaxID=3074108 RepID=UPI00370DBA1A
MLAKMGAVLFIGFTKILTGARLVWRGYQVESKQRLFVPVWLDNLKRTMPKGHMIRLPLLCTLAIGKLLPVNQQQTCQRFVEKTCQTFIALAKGK